MEDTMLLLIDDHHGVYVPYVFQSEFKHDVWQGISDVDWQDITDSDNEHYWDAWEDILINAVHVDEDGHKWTLHQDGDLWAVREDHKWEDE